MTQSTEDLASAYRASLADLASWARNQLTANILPYWDLHARDSSGEGFLGEIRADNTGVPETERSVVMVSRHLWTYSAASRMLADPSRLALANDAYRYLLDRFRDRVHGGFYWTVKRDGSPAVMKKQIYGQAFALYALSEYARLPYLREEVRAEALSFALALYELLERHARERSFGGYLEALAQDWATTDDRTLSPVDLDCDKSMNTNLHVLEALTNLYRVAPTQGLRESIVSLLDVHARCIVQADGHLGLFYHMDWTRMDRKVSYGHDIEASWLMEEAIEVLDTSGGAGGENLGEAGLGGEGADARTEQETFMAARGAIAALAESALKEGLDRSSFALEEEAESSSPGAARNRHRIWWCQAEAMVGFLAAWQRTREARYLEAAVGVRDYIDRVLVDRAGGEWFWGADGGDVPVASQAKGGNWKAGYHDGRACMELIHRAAPFV